MTCGERKWFSFGKTRNRSDRFPRFSHRISGQRMFIEGGHMYHYDAITALEELNEEAVLPNPVHLRDMMLRKRLKPEQSLELNRLFSEYQKFFGEAQKLGKTILSELEGL